MRLLPLLLFFLTTSCSVEPRSPRYNPTPDTPGETGGEPLPGEPKTQPQPESEPETGVTPGDDFPQTPTEPAPDINDLPQIQSLKILQPAYISGQVLQVEIETADPDGDKLRAEVILSSDRGLSFDQVIVEDFAVTSSPAVISWPIPEGFAQGIAYAVRVSVTDGKAEKSVQSEPSAVFGIATTRVAYRGEDGGVRAILHKSCNGGSCHTDLGGWDDVFNLDVYSNGVSGAADVIDAVITTGSPGGGMPPVSTSLPHFTADDIEKLMLWKWLGLPEE